MTKKDYDKMFTRLLELFPNPDTELNYETPFQLLVAVMLSAQTTDKQVNVVTDKLFLKVKNPEDVVKISEEKLAKQVSSVNYYKMKAKHIKQSAEKLVELAKDKKNKLTKNERIKSLKIIKETLKLNENDKIIMTSSETKEGLNEVLALFD